MVVVSSSNTVSRSEHIEDEQRKFFGLSTSPFLVSFLVDARGGSMRGSRHPGLRILIPPNAASAPTRITCRMLRPERTTRPPQLNDCEGLACRIIELGPHPCKFNTPVILEIPHFASLRNRQRELVVLRSDNAETWREHSLEATDQAIQTALGQNFDCLETMEELREKRIIRILTTDFPQYLALVSRLRQESALIGSDGGVLSSTVVPQVQAVFPEGAFQKRIRVGLQAQPIAPELVNYILGNRVSVSPIVTLEPRRRKFHKPITLTIPLPKTTSRGVTALNEFKPQSAPTLRLLCSITGGTSPAQWEDITGSTPLSKVKDCVSFTTTVSARFWLMDCHAVQDAAELAGRLYKEATLIPYMGKFVVFTKRLDTDEALIRCFCITDDKVDKTLECQEGFEVCAASPEVEVVEGRPAWLETTGNLLPVAKVDEQLRLTFNAFRENRLAFPVRVKDPQQEATGKLVFMRDPRHGPHYGRELDSMTQPTDAFTPGGSNHKPLCTLEVHIGFDLLNGAMTDSSLAALEAHRIKLVQSDRLANSTAPSLSSLNCVFPVKSTTGQIRSAPNGDLNSDWVSLYTADVIARSQLDLVHVAHEVGSDWPLLLEVLHPESGLNRDCTVNQLVNWIHKSENRWQNRHGGATSRGFGALTVNPSELRTCHDQALAVLLAWREERGDAATGNELNRALRLIGREDVVKSCMRGIEYVTNLEERAEASRRIDDHITGEPARASSPEDPLATSIAGTETLLSGMEDFTADNLVNTQLLYQQNYGKQEKFNQIYSGIISPISNESESFLTMAHSKNDRAHEEDIESENDLLANEIDIHAQSPENDRQEYWRAAGASPARSTSQYGGDPLLIEDKSNELMRNFEEADMLKESESMTSSLENQKESTDLPGEKYLEKVREPPCNEAELTPTAVVSTEFILPTSNGNQCTTVVPTQEHKWNQEADLSEAGQDTFKGEESTTQEDLLASNAQRDEGFIQELVEPTEEKSPHLTNAEPALDINGVPASSPAATDFTKTEVEQLGQLQEQSLEQNGPHVDGEMELHMLDAHHSGGEFSAAETSPDHVEAYDEHRDTEPQNTEHLTALNAHHGLEFTGQ